MDEGELDLDFAFSRAVERIKKKQREEGLQLLTDIVGNRYGMPDHKMLARVYHRLLKTYADLERWPEAAAAAERALKPLPENAEIHFRAGEAHYFLGRREEARTAFERALELDPDMTEALSSLALLREAGEPPPDRPVRVWPKRQADFANPRALIRKYLLRGRPRDRFITDRTVFFTLGSCFAANLARQLKAKGHRVGYQTVGEEVNSTFANRSLLEWIENGVVDEPTSVMDRIYGPGMRENFRAGLRDCDVFVMTLGAAACFFREDTGAFAFAPLKTSMDYANLYGRCRMRTTTVAENVENVAAIISALRRLNEGSPRVVLTVSPVPLAATSEHYSAIRADALSKSTLLLACEEAVAAHAAQGALYWPSFEMVRWLGAHYDAAHAPYAHEHGNSRHVSAWLIETIVDMFLETHSL